MTAVRSFTARARVEAVLDGSGTTRLRSLRSEGPLALRASGGAVYVVGAGGGPLGGDEYTLDVEVGEGAVLRLCSAAATVVLPGADGAESAYTVRARVGAGASLVLSPEPVVVTAGARHRSRTSVELAGDAVLLLRERLVLGRHGERAGSYHGRTDVTVDEVALLRQAVKLGDPVTERSHAVLGGAKALGSTLLAGPFWVREREAYADGGVVVMPLAGPGTLVSATGADAAELGRRLRLGEELAGVGEAKPGGVGYALLE